MSSRVASTINLGVAARFQRPVRVISPITAPVRITEEQIADPTVLAKQLNALHTEIANATQATRSSHIQGSVLFTNVVVGAGGAKTVLQHNFGKYAFFLVVGWRGNGVVTAPVLVDDRADSSGVLTSDARLALRSHVAGIADIMVWA